MKSGDEQQHFIHVLIEIKRFLRETIHTHCIINTRNNQYEKQLLARIDNMYPHPLYYQDFKSIGRNLQLRDQPVQISCFHCNHSARFAERSNGFGQSETNFRHFEARRINN